MAEKMDTFFGWLPCKFMISNFWVITPLTHRICFPNTYHFLDQQSLTFLLIAPRGLNFLLPQEKSFQSLFPNTCNLPFLFVQKYLYFLLRLFPSTRLLNFIFTREISFTRGLVLHKLICLFSDAFNEQSWFEGRACLHFYNDTISSSDLLSYFHVGCPKVPQRQHTPKEVHFPQTYISSKISVKQSSSIWSHQSPNSGHHCRQFSCIFLISIHCFRAWHKVETEQIFIKWNLPTYISHLLRLSPFFHWVVKPSPTPGWLTPVPSTMITFVFSVIFLHCLWLPLVCNIFKVLTKFLWVEINFFL